MLNQFLFDCSLRGLGILNYENHRVSGEGAFLKRLAPAFFQTPSPLVVDVGANVGNYTDLVLEMLPDCRVVAFEPNPDVFQNLSGLFSPDRVTVEMKGLGASDEVLKFYDRQDRGGASAHGSLYREVIEDLHHVDAVEKEITTTTLDGYAEASGIDHIHLLKIDTEGHELEVLRGASGLLQQKQIDLIQIEFNEMNVISRVFFRDFAETLSDYRAFRLLPSGVLPIKNYPLKTELFAFQNLVFVHNRFAPSDRMKPAA